MHSQGRVAMNYGREFVRRFAPFGRADDVKRTVPIVWYRQFSLKFALVAVTLVACGLGIALWASYKPPVPPRIALQYFTSGSGQFLIEGKVTTLLDVEPLGTLDEAAWYVHSEIVHLKKADLERSNAISTRYKQFFDRAKRAGLLNMRPPNIFRGEPLSQATVRLEVEKDEDRAFREERRLAAERYFAARGKAMPGSKR
jgi:hypothetical protein